MHESQVNQRNLFPLAPERAGRVAARQVGRCGQVDCSSARVLFEQVFVFFFSWAGLAGHERKAQRFEVIMKQHL